MLRRNGFAGLVLTGLLGGLTGCGGGDGSEHLPLGPGQTWTYRVRSGFEVAVEPVKVAEPIAVGEASGWRLTSPMGESRLAWRDGVLVAERLPGTRFSPPIPLLKTDLGRPMREWRGMVSADGVTRSGTADLRVVEERVTHAGRPRDALRSTVDLQLGSSSLVLDTWFVPRVGIVRQEFRRDNDLERALDWVAGP